MNILITEPNNLSEKALSIYKSLGNVYFFSPQAKESLLQKINVLVVGLDYKIDRKWFDKMSKLKLIASPTTGLDHIDLKESERRKIKVISLKEQTNVLTNVTSTAELTIALILSLVRNIPWAFDSVKSGQWNRNLFKGIQLVGKTIGLLGFGRLGKIVAKYCRTFGMNVIAFDPYVKKNVFDYYKAKQVNLKTLFKESDILSVHCSLTKETTRLICERHFKLMKPTAFFVNTARGKIVDERALVEALKKKWIAGAALDVLTNEDSNGSHLEKSPLLEYAKKNKNLIIVPHLGGATFEAIEFTSTLIAKQVKNYLLKQ